MEYAELINLRNAIQDVDFESFQALVRERNIDFSTIKQTFPRVDIHLSEFNAFKKTLQTELNNITNSLGAIDKAKRYYLEQIYKVIRDETFERIVNDNISYQQQSSLFRTAEYYRKYTKMPVQESTIEIIKARIGAYVDWQYPALEIGPGDGEMTNLLVACDPLYIVDYNDEMLESTKSKFSRQYQGRLRCYTNDGYGLHMIPQGQMGLVFSWNVFNYLSLDHINHYLKEIYKVLRPGGACIFSYNNAERPGCAMQSDREFMTFIPETILLKVIKNLGYIDVKAINKDTLLSWVEFRKPGELSSIRAGQTLGKIINTLDIKT